MNTSWRHLEDVFRLCLQKMFSRCVQDVLIKTNIFALVIRLQKTSSRRLGQDQYIRLSYTSSRRLQDVFKTSWSRPIYSSWPYVFKTSSRRFQDVFKTSSRRFQDVFKTSCKNVFKTSSRRLQDVLKTSSKRLQDVFKTSSRHLQDAFKTYHQVKLLLLTRLWEAFNTFLRRSFPKMVIYRGICLGNTISDKFMVSIQNLQER